MINGANTDFIQASIEIFGTVITIVLAIVLTLITGNKKKSEKNLFVLILVSGVALLVDAGWYIYDGNTSYAGIIVNHICNFVIFICNPAMICFANAYLCHLIKEKGSEYNKRFMYAAFTFATLAVIIPVSNIFYKWMYFIDEQNIYHRLDGWYVYTILNSMSIIVFIIMVLVQKKTIERNHRIALYVFLLAPFVGIALQSFTMGISFIQIGNAVGCVGILSAYLLEWIRKEKASNETSEEKKKFRLIECVFLIMILCISASIISFVISVKSVSNENSQQTSTALAYMVCETIDAALSEPIDVSKTMACSEIVIEALSMDELENTETEAKLLSYMKRVEDEFGYQMIFAASEKTKAYYTYSGLSRYMDFEESNDDAWYNEFKDRKIPYELNIDTDKDNDMALAVFVNMEVRDEEDNLIGVCGVGMSLESLMDVLAQYEEEYSLDISLVKPDGLIQVDSDREKIEQLYLDTSYLENVNKNEIYYSRDGLRSHLVKYMDNQDWYMYIEDKNPDKLNVMSIILPSMIIYILGISLMMIFTFLFGIHERRRNRELRESRSLSETDTLTGIKNRYCLDKLIEDLDGEGSMENLFVAMIDINGLKTVNDSFGHDSGDELIKGTAECLYSVFNEKADVFRTGGDEFIIIGKDDELSIEQAFRLLNEKTATWKGSKVKNLALSVGYVCHDAYPQYSMEELMKLADELMYQDKNRYYEKTDKERRRR